MNISLPPALEKFVQDKVGTGHYSTASEVVREGLRALQEQDRKRYDLLRHEIQLGIDEIDRGEGISYESIDAFIGEVRKKLHARFKKKSSSKKS